MSWGYRHQIKKAVQSSINTVNYTTNEDERQNCISDIVNNLNNVDKHVDDPNEVEGLNVEETSCENEIEEEEALNMEEDPIDCAVCNTTCLCFVREESLSNFL